MIQLDGYSLRFGDLRSIATGEKIRIKAAVRGRVQRSRSIVEALAQGEKPVYGVNTGFGYFANQKIEKKKLLALQKNIITSHSGGYGKALSPEETRLMLCLRLNLMLKGFSGVRYELCAAILRFLDAGILPVVPEYGSVGASGDLIPLSHLGLGLMGEGSVWYRGKYMPAKEALRRARLKPYVYTEKEGLSFVNGTECMQAVGGLALESALDLMEKADRVAALSFEGLDAHVAALRPEIHAARGQSGQLQCARNILRELRGSYLHRGTRSHGRVQDPYSLRCAPQIHGPSRDALGYARSIVEKEINAVTDNPLVFAREKKIISGGNFHGQALSMVYDIAAIACAELANVSERRLELLCNPQKSGLPAFLAAEGGVNSGYMVFQYLSASLVNENKILSHPACTDSIPGNVGVEDHVSMGMTAARKLRKVVENTRVALTLEAVAAAQAIDLRRAARKLGAGSGRSYRLIRRAVPVLKNDRVVAQDIQKALKVFPLL